jgi:chromosome partitioning protein
MFYQLYETPIALCCGGLGNRSERLMAGVTIAMLNPKGGVGKTTIALLLAGEMAERGIATGLVDLDRRGNVVSWAEKAKRRGLTLPLITVHDGRDADAAVHLPTWIAASRFCVVDLPGEETTAAAAAVALSDCVVTPLKVSEQDVAGARAAQRFVQRIGAETRRAIPQLFVVNEITLNKERSILYRAFDEVAASFGMRIAATRIREKDRLNRLTGTEGTLFTMQEESAAWTSCAALGAHLANEVLALVQAERQAA